jgi:hypothetical protein
MADFGWGGAIGGFINGAVNAINAAEERDEARRARQERARSVEQGRQMAMHDYDKMEELLRDYDGGRIRLADDQMVNDLRSAINSYEPEVYNFGKFGDEYNKTVDDFLNPEAERIANLAGLKTQADLASRGAAKGTGGLAGIGYSRWDAANQLYKDAQQALQNDRTQAYTEYSDFIKNMQNKLDTLNQGKLKKVDLLSGAVSNEQTAQSDYMSDLMSLMGDRAQTNVNAKIGAFS